MVNHGNAHSYTNKGTNAMRTQPKPSIGIKLKKKLTIALFLNIYCMLKWAQHANCIYIWLNSMVNYGNAPSYANTGVYAMGTQPKPSFGIKLK